MSYNPPSEKDEIDSINKRIGVVRNISRFANPPINTDTAAFGMGSSSAKGGKNHGVQFFTPVTHTVTTDGSSRKHIALQSTIAIVDDPTTSGVLLHYIDGTYNNGQFIMIKPLKGKTLTLKKATVLDNTVGNLYLDNDVTLAENEFFLLLFINDLGTGGGFYINALGSSGGGGSNLWSNITIDIDKNMGTHSLSNLTTLSFDAVSGSSSKKIFGSGAGITYNVPNGSSHFFDAGANPLFQATNTATFWSTNIDMQSNSIININSLTFKSSTAINPIITSDGNDVNVQLNIHNSDIAHFSNSFNAGTGVPDNGILEIFGNSHGLHSGVLWIPSIKTVCNLTPSNGDSIGGLYFDSVNSTGVTQKTFANIIGGADVVTSGSEKGAMYFSTISNGTLFTQMTISTLGGIVCSAGLFCSSGMEVTGGNIVWDDGVNIFTGTTTGTKISTSSTQKLGFWGHTPVVRQTVVGSRSGGAALQSLLNALNTAGIILDSSTA